MFSTQNIAIFVGVILALVAVLILTTRKIHKYERNRKPTLVRAFALFFNGDEVGSLEELKSLALSNNGSLEIYLAIGFLYRRLKEYAKAAQVHEVLLVNKDVSKETKAYITTELAKDYMLLNLYDKALNALRNSDLKTPEDLIIIAEANYKMGNIEAAISFHNKYHKLTGKYIYGFFAKCMIYNALHAKDDSKALKFIKEALKDSPKCRAARFINLNLLIKEKKEKRALEECRSIVTDALLRNEEDINAVKANYITLGIESELIKDYNSAAIKYPKNALVAVGLARAYKEAELLEDAKFALETYFKNKNHNALAVIEYGKLIGNKAIQAMGEDALLYRCIACKEEYEKYSEACDCCEAFDSIVIK